MNDYNLLVLEDSISDQLSLEIILDEYPLLKPVFVKNSDEFLIKISDNQAQMVIADIMLNESKTGLDLVSQLPNSAIWLIICSSHDCKEHYDQLKSLNFTKFYMQKPIEEYELRTHLDSFIVSKNLKI